MGDADRLPMANVSRIIAQTLPKDAAVSKEARVALSACATVFVHYITELAVQQCDKRKKVTIAPDDIMEALKEAEFEDFQGPLQASLDAFQGAAKAAKTAKASSAKRQKLNESHNDENAEAGEGDEETQEQNASQEVGEGAEGGNQETPVAGAVAKEEEEEEEKTVATVATEGGDATQADA